MEPAGRPRSAALGGERGGRASGPCARREDEEDEAGRQGRQARAGGRPAEGCVRGQVLRLQQEGGGAQSTSRTGTAAAVGLHALWSACGHPGAARGRASVLHLQHPLPAGARAAGRSGSRRWTSCARRSRRSTTRTRRRAARRPPRSGSTSPRTASCFPEHHAREYEAEAARLRASSAKERTRARSTWSAPSPSGIARRSSTGPSTRPTSRRQAPRGRGRADPQGPVRRAAVQGPRHVLRVRRARRGAHGGGDRVGRLRHPGGRYARRLGDRSRSSGARISASNTRSPRTTSPSSRSSPRRSESSWGRRYSRGR